jgi:hypothetical protein
MSTIKKRLECGPFRVVVEVEVDVDDANVVASLKLPFSPNQWLDLVNEESESFPPCCHDIEEARAQFVRALQNGRWINGQKLSELCLDLSAHDAYAYMTNGVLLDEYTAKIARGPNPKELPPLVVMAWLCRLLDFAIHHSTLPSHPPSISYAAREVARAATELSSDLALLEVPITAELEERRQRSGTDPRAVNCTRIRMILHAARFLASRKPLDRYLSNHFPAPIPAYVVVRADTGQPLEYAPEIFTSRRQAEHRFGIDVDIEEKVYSGPGRNAYRLHLCTVSLDGVEVGDPVPWWSETDELMHAAMQTKKAWEGNEVVCVIEQRWDGVESSRIWRRGEVVGIYGEGEEERAHVCFEDMHSEGFVPMRLDEIGLVQ